MVNRFLTATIQEKLFKGKAIILLGPRQVGKTTLIKALFNYSRETIWLNGDEPDVQQLFTHMSAARMRAFIGDKKILVIDEAQRISDIGLRLKLITDEIQHVQLLATGSSAFELANHLNEPLTGRKWEYKMFPISFAEMVQHHGLLDEKRMLPHRLVYGYYPDVVNNMGSEKEILQQLSESYLYKDVLSLDKVKKPSGFVKLLQALAFQIGGQVSYHELAGLSGLDGKTVEKYIELLEQAYIVFRVGSFSRNLRNELTKSRKIYFYDNGIRNSLIAQFSQIENRQDIGPLWENFLMSERMKHLAYSHQWVNTWFWRTKDGQEIDLIEESDGQLNAYEFKWNPLAKVKKTNAFIRTYQGSTMMHIHKDNFESFLGV